MITLTLTHVHIIAAIAAMISLLLDAYVVGALRERKRQAKGDHNEEEV